MIREILIYSFVEHESYTLLFVREIFYEFSSHYFLLYEFNQYNLPNKLKLLPAFNNLEGLKSWRKTAYKVTKISWRSRFDCGDTAYKSNALGSCMNLRRNSLKTHVKLSFIINLKNKWSIGKWSSKNVPKHENSDNLCSKFS